MWEMFVYAHDVPPMAMIFDVLDVEFPRNIKKCLGLLHFMEFSFASHPFFPSFILPAPCVLP
jgi:hypothetical protein